MENVESYKVDKPEKRGHSCPNGSDGPKDLDLVGPVDLLDNDLDLNEKEKLWVEKMNQLNTERSREDQTKNEHLKEDSVDSSEFSPIVYWKEPLPEVLPLDIEEEPAKVSVDSAPSSCPTPGDLTASSSTLRSSQQSRALSCCLVSSVWVDRYKYQDAEVKYYQLKSQEEKSKPTMEEREVPPPHSDQSFQTSTKLNPEKEKEKEEEEEEDDRAFEDYLERLATDNLEIRKTVSQLTDCVMQLQQRIKTLELGNKKLSVKNYYFPL